MKSATVKLGELLHVETPLGIVNIRAGLTDYRGRRVDSISVTPTSTCGERKVALRGLHNTRFVELKTVVENG